MKQFSDSLVVITGAAGALGRAVMRAFDEASARMLLVDVNAKALEALLEPGSRHLTAAVNLMDADATLNTLAPLIESHGPALVLCNVAGGFTMGKAVHATPDAMWHQMMDLNVSTLINASRAVVPGMIAAGQGKIINVAASSAVTGKPKMGAYCASKSAVVRLTESMALELRDHGINVNAVAPSVIDTASNRAAMPSADPSRWVAPQELANVIHFLASDAASAIHGAVVPVVGRS